MHALILEDNSSTYLNGVNIAMLHGQVKTISIHLILGAYGHSKYKNVRYFLSLGALHAMHIRVHSISDSCHSKFLYIQS